MTLVSRAVALRISLLSTLADLSENLLDRRLGERWPFLGGYRDPEGTALNDLDLAWQRFDLDLPLLDRDPQRHPRKDSSLIPNRFGEDKPAGRIDGGLNGISHGSQNTMKQPQSTGELHQTAVPLEGGHLVSERGPQEERYTGSMPTPKEELIAARFQTILALFETAEAMLRQKLRRKHPEASEAEIEAQVREWLQRRPGAEYGDGVGVPVAWPRRS